MDKIKLELTVNRLNALNSIWVLVDYTSFSTATARKVHHCVFNKLGVKLSKLAITKTTVKEDKKFSVKLEVYEAYYLANAIVLTEHKTKGLERSILNNIFHFIHQKLA